MQQNVWPWYAASTDLMPANVCQPYLDSSAIPLSSPGEARDNQHVPAEDLQ